MELTNEFRVSVPIEEAWKVLTDLERIAPCMPGAQLTEVEGDEYRGLVKVKVGPITVQYKGIARMVEKDDTADKAVLRAEGRETKGQGNASANVTATLTEDGDGTIVEITTDLAITGKVAQFGRGLMADVTGKLLDQFVQQLEADVLSSGSAAANEQAPPVKATATKTAAAPAAAAPATKTAAPKAAPTTVSSAASESTADANEKPKIRVINSQPVEPVDLLDAAGSPVAKRLIPLFGGAAVLALVIWWLVSRK